MKIFEIILNNFWAKIIALVLAAATWFSVYDIVTTEIMSKNKETAETVLAKTKFLVKEVPVRVLYAGRSPEGYKVDMANVKVTPHVMSIMGPEGVVDSLKELRTDPVNLGEYTKSAVLRLKVHSDVKAIRVNEKVVEVELPVLNIKDAVLAAKEAK